MVAVTSVLDVDTAALPGSAAQPPLVGETDLALALVADVYLAVTTDPLVWTAPSSSRRGSRAWALHRLDIAARLSNDDYLDGSLAPVQAAATPGVLRARAYPLLADVLAVPYDDRYLWWRVGLVHAVLYADPRVASIRDRIAMAHDLLPPLHQFMPVADKLLWVSASVDGCRLAVLLVLLGRTPDESGEQVVERALAVAYSHRPEA